MSKKRGVYWYVSTIFFLIAIICLIFVIGLFFFPNNPILKSNLPKEIKNVKPIKSKRIENTIDKLRKKGFKEKKEKSELNENNNKTITFTEEEINNHIEYLIKEKKLKNKGLKHFYLKLEENKLKGFAVIDSRKTGKKLKSKLPINIKGDIDLAFSGYIKKYGGRIFFKIDSIKIGKLPLIDGLKDKLLGKFVIKNKLQDTYSKENGFSLPPEIKDVSIHKNSLIITYF